MSEPSGYFFEEVENKDVLYLCDRRACKKCNSTRDGETCRHTSDISHAKNFEVGPYEGYWEKESKPLLVLKADRLLKREVIDRIRNDIKRQIDEGLVLVDGFITEIKLKQDEYGPLLICQVENQRKRWR